MKKYIIIFVSGLLVTSSLMAQQRQTPAELTTKTHMQHTMMLLAQLDVGDGVYSTNANDIIYAFIEGECRGTASPMPQHNGLIFLSIGENSEQPKAIELMVWLEERQELLPINETFSFAPFKAEGELNEPVILTLGEMVGVGEQADGGWFIGEAFPNPFDNHSMIPYKLKEQAKVQLKLFNSQGQLLRRITESHIQKGACHIKIHKGSLAPGLYIAVIEIHAENDFIQASRVVMVK